MVIVELKGNDEMKTGANSMENPSFEERVARYERFLESFPTEDLIELAGALFPDRLEESIPPHLKDTAEIVLGRQFA